MDHVKTGSKLGLEAVGPDLCSNGRECPIILCVLGSWAMPFFMLPLSEYLFLFFCLAFSYLSFMTQYRL